MSKKYKCIKENTYVEKGDVIDVDFIFRNPDYVNTGDKPRCVLRLETSIVVDVDFLDEHFILLKEHRINTIEKLL